MRRLIFGLFFALVGACFLSSCQPYSSGEKTGVIVKLADEGMLNKTHEGELIRGGMTNGTGVIGRPFDFTISEDKLINKAKLALDIGREVKVSYHRDYFAPLSSGNEYNYFVDSIEFTKQVNK